MIDLEIFKDKSIQSDAVNARSLWLNLESKQDFSNWIKNKVVNNPLFVVNEDWCLLNNIIEQKSGSGGHNKTEYALTLNTAKQVALMENTLKGKEIRQYFIDYEKNGKALPDFHNPAAMVLIWQENERLKKQLKATQDEFDSAMDRLYDLFRETRGYTPKVLDYKPEIAPIKTYLEGKNVVCIAEIWDKVLKRNFQDFNRYSTREVNEIMRGLSGWRQTDSTKNFKEYGKQKFWKKIRLTTLQIQTRRLKPPFLLCISMLDGKQYKQLETIVVY